VNSVPLATVFRSNSQQALLHDKGQRTVINLPYASPHPQVEVRSDASIGHAKRQRKVAAAKVADGQRSRAARGVSTPKGRLHRQQETPDKPNAPEAQPDAQEQARINTLREVNKEYRKLYSGSSKKVLHDE
jgi:hypothetical protein